MDQMTGLPLPEVTQRPGVRSVSRQCEVRAEGGTIVVVLDTGVLLRFDEGDVAMQRLAMVLLSDREVAKHDDIAAAFGVKSLEVDRARKAYREHGIAGLVPKRRGVKGPRVTGGNVDALILASKRAGWSNRGIATRLGVSGRSVGRALQRLGWIPAQSEPLPVTEPIAVEESSQDGAIQATTDCESSPSASESGADVGKCTPETKADISVPAVVTLDTDPMDRSIDRFLAVQGLLDDAAPLFGDAQGTRDVGALLAIPVMATQGVFHEALECFHAIGPAFYGLRTAIVCLSLLMALNLCRPQHVMQRQPRSLGRLLGLDRSPEVKTLRRKVNMLAAQGKSASWMDKLARRQLHQSDDHHIWAYLDGHVSVYSGKRTMREHHVTRLRASRPSVLDYWVNQPNGAPLMVVTGAPKESMVEVIAMVVDKLRALAPGKTLTMVFDREGWSPKLFARLAKMDRVHILTYRKASSGKRLPILPVSDFQEHTWQSDGRTFHYQLVDKLVRIFYKEGKRQRFVEMRQITRLKKDGKQTHVLTTDFERSGVELAHRMFHRWTQENFFKYDGEHRDIDALVTHRTEPADGTRMVPNPERAKFDKVLIRLRAEAQSILEHYGRTRLASSPPPSAGEETYSALIGELEAKIARCEQKRDALPAKVPWKTTQKGAKGVQPRIEHRRLMHGFRMVADRAEIGLLELLRPHFADWRHEGRSLLRQILHSSGDLSVSDSHLTVTIDPLASPYKTRALAALCADINKLDATFPGSSLKLEFRVRPDVSVS